MMRRRSLFAALFLASGAFAAERNPDVLKGLGSTLCVAAEEPGPEARQAGLTADRLKASVAEALARAQFRLAEKAPACLRVSVLTHTIPATGFVSHYVELSLVEEVAPVRAGAPRVQAPTWVYGTVGTSLSGRLGSAVSTTISASVGVFVDDYQLVDGSP